MVVVFAGDVEKSVRRKTMKVVINKCFGGFGLSDKAVEACIALGMTVGNEGDIENKDFIRRKKAGFGCNYYIYSENDKKFRCDLRLVQVVEQLGNEANSNFSYLKVVDIPFEDCEGWYIHDYDGMESIEEEHCSWG